MGVQGQVGRQHKTCSDDTRLTYQATLFSCLTQRGLSSTGRQLLQEQGTAGSPGTWATALEQTQHAEG